MTSTLAGRGWATRSLRKPLRGYAFFLPTLLIFGLFSWYPLVRGIILAFQNDNLVSSATWSGLTNFRTVLDDGMFITAWKNTGEFVLIGLLFGYAVPLVVAVWLSEMRH